MSRAALIARGPRVPQGVAVVYSTNLDQTEVEMWHRGYHTSRLPGAPPPPRVSPAVAGELPEAIYDEVYDWAERLLVVCAMRDYPFALAHLRRVLAGRGGTLLVRAAHLDADRGCLAEFYSLNEPPGSGRGSRQPGPAAEADTFRAAVSLGGSYRLRRVECRPLMDAVRYCRALYTRGTTPGLAEVAGPPVALGRRLSRLARAALAVPGVLAHGDDTSRRLAAASLAYEKSQRLPLDIEVEVADPAQALEGVGVSTPGQPTPHERYLALFGKKLGAAGRCECRAIFSRADPLVPLAFFLFEGGAGHVLTFPLTSG